ncbi:MAG TPA: hypothetical protein VJ896_10615 [Bacteroidales bacterium]|nr:hypothetical protein [Bacteroidales bacterium]
MKKVFAILVLTLFSLSVGTTSCSDDVKNPVDCVQLLSDYTEAHTAYVQDPDNVDKCVTLKNAIEDYLDSDCPALTPQMRETLNQELDALNC